ncbi:hypothetical protein DERF_011536 [Dermatophagoides farinae]|uniref:Uncharacterized protein n=1 Tax=Dermatophagoides farinae TaxID=6954 RepID=A0A922HSD8_DERFA|nr:hypothetical protein DERF_011536 [Dermatophagoides farinae]
MIVIDFHNHHVDVGDDDDIVERQHFYNQQQPQQHHLRIRHSKQDINNEINVELIRLKSKNILATYAHGHRIWYKQKSKNFLGGVLFSNQHDGNKQKKVKANSPNKEILASSSQKVKMKYYCLPRNDLEI